MDIRSTYNLTEIDVTTYSKLEYIFTRLLKLGYNRSIPTKEEYEVENVVIRLLAIHNWLTSPNVPQTKELEQIDDKFDRLLDAITEQLCNWHVEEKITDYRFDGEEKETIFLDGVCPICKSVPQIDTIGGQSQGYCQCSKTPIFDTPTEAKFHYQLFVDWMS